MSQAGSHLPSGQQQGSSPQDKIKRHCSSKINPDCGSGHGRRDMWLSSDPSWGLVLPGPEPAGGHGHRVGVFGARLMLLTKACDSTQRAMAASNWAAACPLCWASLLLVLRALGQGLGLFHPLPFSAPLLFLPSHNADFEVQSSTRGREDPITQNAFCTHKNPSCFIAPNS